MKTFSQQRGRECRASSEVILVDVACSRCGRNLRGLSWGDECPECALPASRSMSVKAVRSGNSQQLHQLAAGLDAQRWAAMLGLLLAISGRFFFREGVDVPLLAGAAASGVSFLGALLMCQSWRKLPGEPCDQCRSRGQRVTMAAGSGAMMLCTLPLSLTYSSNISPLLFASFMLCGVCWFAGDVARLHFVQQVSDYICDPRTRRQACHLRWGMYLLLGLIMLPLVLSFPGMKCDASLMTPSLFLMLASASFLLFSLLSATICGHVSRLVQQQARYTELMERGGVVIQTDAGAWLLPCPAGLWRHNREANRVS